MKPVLSFHYYGLELLSTMPTAAFVLHKTFSYFGFNDFVYEYFFHLLLHVVNLHF